MWWQILLMVLAVLFIVMSIYYTISRILDIIINERESCAWWPAVMFLTIGISYLIWFCN